MDHTYVDENSLKSLEDYAFHLFAGLKTLETLQNLQVRAIKIGILPEDLNEITHVICGDLQRGMNLYLQQITSVLELLPDDFNFAHIIKTMKKRELTKARSLTRKIKAEKCDI